MIANVDNPDHYAWNAISPPGIAVVDVSDNHLECIKQDGDYFRLSKREFAERHLEHELTGRWQ